MEFKLGEFAESIELGAHLEVEFLVTETDGYDKPYLCSYCEEYSHDSPDGPCQGCGRDAWLRWELVSFAPDRVKAGDRFVRRPNGLIEKDNG